MANEIEQQGAASAFGFTGSWREFLPIVLTNLLLTIVTLGIYRFWATTRERRYLWSRTRFIDERLEWTGTGLELFFGFITVAILFGIPFVLIQFVANGLLLRGHEGWAALLIFSMFGLVYYLTGVAYFRTLRYRLGRTYWRGIRGGSNIQGFKYGWSYIWKNFVGSLAAYLLVPWAMVSLWNERWNAMSFGQHSFKSNAEFTALMPRFLLFYLVPILFVVVMLVVMVPAIIAGGRGGEPPTAIFGFLGLVVILFYIALPLIWLVYYAKFFRVVVDKLSLHTLGFGFGARTKHWLLLFLGDAALWLGAALIVALIVVPPLALSGFFNVDLTPGDPNTAEALNTVFLAGLFIAVFLPFALVGPFIRYRHWKFFVVYMEAYGEIDVDELTQSSTMRSRHGEGLLDAFDVGAI